MSTAAVEANSAPTVAKTTVECYRIRNLRQGGWADITIDDQGKRGRVSIASDYGSYQNYWEGCGIQFKDFLMRINLEYAADKFRADDWFDAKQTLNNYRTSVLEGRRYGNLAKEKAKALWDEINRLQDYHGEPDFVSGLHEMKNLLAYFDGCPDLSYGVRPIFKKFWDECWSVFMETLRQEISGE